MKKILVSLSLFLIVTLSGCAFGPEEEAGEMREKSMEWPSMRAMPLVDEPGPREPVKQR